MLSSVDEDLELHELMFDCNRINRSAARLSISRQMRQVS